MTYNKKEKCIRLSPLGEACYEKNEALKANLEKKIADKIGHEQLQLLKSDSKIGLGIIVSSDSMPYISWLLELLKILCLQNTV